LLHRNANNMPARLPVQLTARGKGSGAFSLSSEEKAPDPFPPSRPIGHTRRSFQLGQRKGPRRQPLRSDGNGVRGLYHPAWPKGRACSADHRICWSAALPSPTSTRVVIRQCHRVPNVRNAERNPGGPRCGLGGKRLPGALLASVLKAANGSSPGSARGKSPPPTSTRRTLPMATFHRGSASRKRFLTPCHLPGPG